MPSTRRHLSRKEIIDLSILIKKHLTVFPDDKTCDYESGYSDEKIRDTYADPSIPAQVIGNLRRDLYGALRSKPGVAQHKLKDLEDQLRALTERVETLEARDRYISGHPKSHQTEIYPSKTAR